MSDIYYGHGTKEQFDDYMDFINYVFGFNGNQNDFKKLLNGVNLLAVADNGQRVVTNLFEALEPVLVEGARRCAGDLAAKAKEARQKRA